MKPSPTHCQNDMSNTSQQRVAVRDASTKERILNVAERLFVNDGYSKSSMRQITAKAGASLGAVNYHFGSKEELLEAVVERQFGPLLMERISGLRAVEAALQTDKSEIMLRLLQSWLDPMLRHLAVNPRHVKILYALDQVVAAESKSILRAISPYQNYLVQFGKALHGTRPDLSLETIYWRFHFMIGAVSLALSESEFMLITSEKMCDAADLRCFRSQLLSAAMLMFGFREGDVSRAICSMSEFSH